ncbi:MAG: L-rhamnose mutarotase [Chthoniobacterales bacterium]
MKTRKAFVMSVNAGAEQEYEKRHNPIWPELKKVLKEHGVSNYSIFLHLETRQLFGYAEIESEEQGKPTLRLDKVNQVLALFGHRMEPVAFRAEVGHEAC